MIVAGVITAAVFLSNSNDDYDEPIYEEINKPAEHMSSVPDGYIGIYTSEDLKNVNLNTSANYIIMNDIDMSGVEFTSIETFTGIFNGNNYEIKNYKSNYPMFKEISNATIENLHLIDAIIEQNKNTDKAIDLGGIIGKDSFKTTNTISNCTYIGKITGYGTSSRKKSIDVGGIIGDAYAFTTIENCSFSGDIEIAEGYVTSMGGVVGSLNENCSAINNCFSTGTLIADETSYFGGICGSADVDIYNCYSTCSLDVKTQVNNIGGIAGWVYDGIINATYYYGDIKTEADSVGTIAAEVHSDNNITNQIQYCYYNSNDISAVGDGTPFANVVKLSDDEMNSEASYVGFDFENIWSMGNSEYPFPVLKGSHYSPSTYNASDSDNSNSQRSYNISDIEAAFKQSIANNSIDDIKPYIYPQAQEILDSAYNKGEDDSVLADLHCTIDGFYSDEKQLGNDTIIKKVNNDFNESDLSEQIFEDINNVSNTDDIISIEYSGFEYSTSVYDSSCTLIIVKTENGAYLLAIDD